MRDLTIFYSWQSDNTSVRNSIKTALKKAIKTLRTNGYKIHLKEGAADHPGMTRIDEAVLANIRNCDVFVCDLTPIVESENNKLMPNSNVLVEMGYAIASKGEEYMIGVANMNSQDLNKMPFDIQHMRITPFKDEKELKFSEWIQPILDKVVQKRKQCKPPYTCIIGDSSKRTTIELNPTYRQVNYISKKVYQEESSISQNNKLISEIEKLTNLNKTIQSLKPPSYLSIDKSICSIPLFLFNEGGQALRNCEITMTTSNSSIKSKETNIIKKWPSFNMPQREITQLSTNNFYVRQPIMRDINPSNSFSLNSFYISAPHNIGSFELHWTLSHLNGDPLKGSLTIKWKSNYINETIIVEETSTKAGAHDILPYIEKSNDI